MFQLCFQIGATTQVAAHVGADFDFGAGRRSQMKMGIKTGYGVNLADGNIDLRGQLPQLIGRQIPKLLLNRPEMVEQGARVPFAPRQRFVRLAKSYREQHTPGNADLGTQQSP
jgi:hypothetical protein